jgi:uroporphyrinogen-III synthase
MTRLVVITRPRDQAEPIATELSARRYAVLVEPMLEIVPLKPALPQVGSCTALAFTSANGVHAFAELSPERALPAYAVGESTASALKTAGFRDIREASGDAAGVAALICSTLGNNGPVLHASGRAVARDLAALLEPAGIVVQRIALYDAAPAQSLSKDLVSALYARTIDSVLFFSARTARTFGTLVMKSGLGSMVSASTALCLSEAVAAEARALPWRAVAVAEQPTAGSLLSLLPTLSKTF